MSRTMNTQATVAERIASRVDALIDTLASLEDESERWQLQYGYVPQDITDAVQDAYRDLETYAGYWGFDC